MTAPKNGSLYDTLYVAKMSKSSEAYLLAAQPQRAALNVYDASQPKVGSSRSPGHWFPLPSAQRTD